MYMNIYCLFVSLMYLFVFYLFICQVMQSVYLVPSQTVYPVYALMIIWPTNEPANQPPINQSINPSNRSANQPTIYCSNQSTVHISLVFTNTVYISGISYLI